MKTHDGVEVKVATAVKGLANVATGMSRGNWINVWIHPVTGTFPHFRGKASASDNRYFSSPREEREVTEHVGKRLGEDPTLPSLSSPSIEGTIRSL
jgi:hypothetical protein